ncbi:protein of unknown function [Paraburkholderia kururiensis]
MLGYLIVDKLHPLQLTGMAAGLAEHLGEGGIDRLRFEARVATGDRASVTSETETLGRVARRIDYRTATDFTARPRLAC